MARTVTPRAGARGTGTAGRRRGAATGRAITARSRSASARRKAAGRARIALVTVCVTAALAAVIGVVAVIGNAVRSLSECSAILALSDDRTSVSSWNAEQLDNAAVIMAAGSDLGLSPRDQAIGVMTAMGESSLRNLDYGDWETSGVTNPDGSRTTSIGLFQQQDSWGPREQRMDPHAAATLFYRAMVAAVPDAERQALDPSMIAHRTQINSDADHYAEYWPAAVAVVEKLSGADTGLLPDTPRPAQSTSGTCVS
ncbi:peptidase M23 [Microbacterium timonense]|uniref:peptidase M23 n=1 Tax=Microbacterium timonense TaxID=2086576 RepID=UPI001F219DF6|nr:peptidase M23 [Microbacterium timonense]